MGCTGPGYLAWEMLCAVNILKIYEMLFVAFNSPLNNHILITRRKA